jgi:DNA-binding IclR family transcriptional regulator
MDYNTLSVEMTQMKRDRYLNTSLTKALGVLDLFDDHRRELTLTEVAASIGTRPGSIYPIVYTLEKYGYLVRDRATKRYRLGLKVLTQANCLLSSLDLREQAKPVLKRLAERLATNAHLAVLYGTEVLYLDRAEAGLSLIIPSVIGRRVPSHCTALGKVFLAYGPEVAEQVLSKNELPAVTRSTITDPEALRRQLARVCERGYALDEEEFHEGNVCVAAPVRDYRGSVVAAISVSLVKSRLEHEPLDRFTTAVVEGAREISQAMGYALQG